MPPRLSSHQQAREKREEAVEHLPSERGDAACSLHRALAAMYAAATAMEEEGDDYGEPDLEVLFAVADERLQQIQAGLERTLGERRWYWLRYDPVFPRRQKVRRV